MRRLLHLGCVIAGLLLAACGQEELQHADIYITADAEGFYSSRWEQNQTIGGYGTLKKFIQNLQPPFLLFDGGNWLGSVPENALTKGALSSRFYKKFHTRPLR